MVNIDPENYLLAKGPSHRMSAEMIRDNALKVSGLLVPKIGGKSVYPYQPSGLWDLSDKSWRYRYQHDKDENLYRRSLYTFWKRSAPPPSMLIFCWDSILLIIFLLNSWRIDVSLSPHNKYFFENSGCESKSISW